MGREIEIARGVASNGFIMMAAGATTGRSNMRTTPVTKFMQSQTRIKLVL